MQRLASGHGLTERMIKVVNKILDQLNIELFETGAPTAQSHYGTTLTPIETLVNRPIPARPYVDILLTYLPSADNRTKEFIAIALTEKGLCTASKPLLELFRHDPSLEEPQRWIVGKALYTIDDPNSYPEILEICKQREYRSSRAMLMHTLAKIKTEEALDILVNCLDDPTVRADALEALGRFGDPRAISYIRKTQVTEGLREFETKKRALDVLAEAKSMSLRSDPT